MLKYFNFWIFSIPEHISHFKEKSGIIHEIMSDFIFGFSSKEKKIDWNYDFVLWVQCVFVSNVVAHLKFFYIDSSPLYLFFWSLSNHNRHIFVLYLLFDTRFYLFKKLICDENELSLNWHAIWELKKKYWTFRENWWKSTRTMVRWVLCFFFSSLPHIQ